MQPASFMNGTTCRAKDGTKLAAFDFMGGIAKYHATATNTAESWFPGPPCEISTNGGCYLAWSNSTHYFEEGHYLLQNLSHPLGCPNRSHSSSRIRNGGRAQDGSLRCAAAGRANYRCVATRTPSCAPQRPAGSRPGFCTHQARAAGAGEGNSAGAAPVLPRPAPEPPAPRPAPTPPRRTCRRGHLHVGAPSPRIGPGPLRSARAHSEHAPVLGPTPVKARFGRAHTGERECPRARARASASAFAACARGVRARAHLRACAGVREARVRLRACAGVRV